LPSIDSNQLSDANLSDWFNILSKYANPRGNPSSEMNPPTFLFLLLIFSFPY
jgi:hypothetical protein